MILVVDMNYRKDSLGYNEFVLPIISILEKLERTKVKHYTKLDKNDLDECDKIVLSGTALKDNVTLEQPEKFQWLTRIEKPVLGICAGMQTISLVFGLPLIKCLEIGMANIDTLKQNPLFSSAFKAYALHNYSVIINEEFIPLAESAVCLQAFKHKQKAIYGVLFHPEVRNPEILKNFIKL